MAVSHDLTRHPEALHDSKKDESHLQKGVAHRMRATHRGTCLYG